MNHLLRYLPFLLVFIGGCPSLCFAQITLTEQHVQVVAGLENPRIVGSVVLAEGGKPSIQTAALIELKQEKEYKFKNVQAENVANFSLGNLVQIDATHWLLSGQGRYRVQLIAFDPGLEVARLFIDLGPTPSPPEPEPEPPTPEPDGDAPIPEPGFRVLIVYETAKPNDVPTWLNDGDLWGFLNSHCVKGPTGTPEFRIIDPQEVVSPLLPIWSKALARGQKSLPWLIVSNGKTGYEGPLPKTKPETMAILAKYAEAK